MSKQSQAWKNLEREAAEKLGGRRISRGDNFARSDIDVELIDLPHLKVDCKYRVRHAHHSLLQEVQEKYCKDANDIPVLVTKSHRQRGANVTIPIEHYAALLRCARHWISCLGPETQEVHPLGHQPACAPVPVAGQPPAGPGAGGAARALAGDAYLFQHEKAEHQGEQQAPVRGDEPAQPRQAP